MLYVDIPSSADLKSLASHRDAICVSIYLPTTPVSQEAAGDRIELKNLAKEALRQLETANADKRRVAALMEHLDDLIDDDEFWRFQARSLAVLATPDNARTFRVPNTLVSIVEVSDRFHLKPLLRAVGRPAAGGRKGRWHAQGCRQRSRTRLCQRPLAERPSSRIGRSEGLIAPIRSQGRSGAARAAVRQ
jgi:hypothetical protein